MGAVDGNHRNCDLKVEILAGFFMMVIVTKISPKWNHPWDLKPAEAAALQAKLARQVVRQSRIRIENMATVAGIDAGYRNETAYAAVVVLNLSDLRVLETAVAAKPISFPYVPGLLSFREGPVVLEALDKLKSSPDLLMIDGQGVAHPRRFGIASHIGLLTGIPSVGCAKTRLLGDYEEPQRDRGSTAYLKENGETLGAVVRTRTGVKPVFVSIGHLMDLNGSIRIILRSCRGYRLPEPIRRADQLSKKKDNLHLILIGRN
jgi:deoxyribonuclease V